MRNLVFGFYPGCQVNAHKHAAESMLILNESQFNVSNDIIMVCRQ